MNKIILMGRLTKDPETKDVGVGLVEFDLAVNRKYKTKDGVQKNEVCFFDCQMWGKRSSVIAQYLNQGDPLLLEGRMVQQTWETREGQKRSKYVVNVENFEFIGTGSGGRERGATRTEQPRQEPAENDMDVDDSIPF